MYVWAHDLKQLHSIYIYKMIFQFLDQSYIYFHNFRTENSFKTRNSLRTAAAVLYGFTTQHKPFQMIPRRNFSARARSLDEYVAFPSSSRSSVFYRPLAASSLAGRPSSVGSSICRCRCSPTGLGLIGCSSSGQLVTWLSISWCARRRASWAPCAPS